ncbi:MAG TPA: alpha-N-arabinofuranosidase [Terriglobales bacterium]|jgi:alpha-N-arabinofuranosidase|nr:alpha-N-arabinofuranosidase [Terriglobales bacterium]
MASSSRRKFLRQATTIGAACGASALFGRPLFGQAKMNASDPVRIYIDSRRVVAPLDRNVFGSFLEHLGRAIYEGIYDPGNKLSDANGFRKDVADEVRQMGVPIIRYPGGNFVSGYNWLDGIGPKKDRPRVLDKAWDATNTNQVGTDEFMQWCKLVGCQPLMGLNLGTGTTEQAANLVEYCNLDKGTRWADLRRKNGSEQPYNVKNWCLGNEMDGPWQIGHMTATEYGLKAQDAARQMHAVDPSLKLIACGSSGPAMPTYLEWDREVLEQCYDYVDALSLHRYIGNTEEETGKDSSKFLAMNLSMEKQIAETLAVCDLVQGHKRSPKKLWLSFDEWNVWYRERSGDAVNGHGKEAPHLLEEIYNLEDGLLVGGFLNTLMRNADRVKLACLAQLINVIAPIMTNENGILKQSIYYPYNWALQYARGSVLNVLVESPTYDVAKMGEVAYLDAVATADAGGKTALFILNRDINKPHTVEVNWQDRAPSSVLQSSVLTGDDLKAFNTFESPNKVTPHTMTKPTTAGGKTKFEVPAKSYTVIQWA